MLDDTQNWGGRGGFFPLPEKKNKKNTQNKGPGKNKCCET